MHVAPQLIPPGLLVTEPAPVPVVITVKAYCVGGAGPKFATTFWAEVMVTLHAPVPEHAPPHPVKTAPVAGVAASSISVPAL